MKCPHCGGEVSCLDWLEALERGPGVMPTSSKEIKVEIVEEEPWIRYYSQHDQIYWGKEKAIERAKEKLAKVQSSSGSVKK